MAINNFKKKLYENCIICGKRTHWTKLSNSGECVSCSNFQTVAATGYQVPSQYRPPPPIHCTRCNCNLPPNYNTLGGNPYCTYCYNLATNQALGGWSCSICGGMTHNNSGVCHTCKLTLNQAPKTQPPPQVKCTGCGKLGASSLCIVCFAQNVGYQYASQYYNPNGATQNMPPDRKTVELSNGDNEEWTRVEFQIFDTEGKTVKGLLDLAIAKDAKIFDGRKKCWFIKTDVIKALVSGIESMIKTGALPGWQVVDNRVTLESFEEFFENPGPQGDKPKSFEELAKDFHIICGKIGISAALLAPTDNNLHDLKPIYRKAALIAHPDRNNGDGSKMVELNMIWAQLQPMLK